MALQADYMGLYWMNILICEAKHQDVQIFRFFSVSYIPAYRQ